MKEKITAAILIMSLTAPLGQGIFLKKSYAKRGLLWNVILCNLWTYEPQDLWSGKSSISSIGRGFSGCSFAEEERYETKENSNEEGIFHCCF